MRRVPPVVIACAADAGWGSPLAVMLRSLETHLPPGRGLVAHVFDGGLEERDRARVRRSLEPRTTLEWHTPDRGHLKGLPLWGHVSASTYDRLAIGRQLPADLSRVIWLDCDVLVLDDLSELYDAEAGPCPVLAVRDPLVRTVSSRFGVQGYRTLGLDPGTPYFNAGVMRIDLESWRAENIETKALAYLHEHASDVWFHDQEALNATLGGSWGRLPSRWNWSVHPMHARRTPASGERPSIVHFCGARKPWIHGGRGPWHTRFFDYVDRTDWAGERPTVGLWGRLLARHEQSRLRRFSSPLENADMRIRSRLGRRWLS